MATVSFSIEAWEVASVLITVIIVLWWFCEGWIAIPNQRTPVRPQPALTEAATGRKGGIRGRTAECFGRL